MHRLVLWTSVLSISLILLTTTDFSSLTHTLRNWSLSGTNLPEICINRPSQAGNHFHYNDDDKPSTPTMTGPFEDALREAVDNGDDKAVKKLLASGGDVYAKLSDDGTTALHIAVSK